MIATDAPRPRALSPVPNKNVASNGPLSPPRSKNNLYVHDLTFSPDPIMTIKLGLSGLFLAHLLACAAFSTLAPGLRASDTPRPLNEWYFADMLRTPDDTTPAKAIHGTQGPTLEWIIVFNPTAKDATVAITHYYENKEPNTFEIAVPAGAKRAWGGHSHNVPDAQMPMGKLYGVRVRSVQKIIVQVTRAEQEHGVKASETMPGRSFLSRLAYPGPLSKRETAWAYADCIIQRTNPLALELEWLTILNPNPGREAKIKVVFSGGKERIEHDLTLAAERVTTISLEQLTKLPEHQGFGVIVRSDVPVIAEQVRRYWYRKHPAPAGTWIVTGYPVGDQDLP
jgi:hypothetical protein